MDSERVGIARQRALDPSVNAGDLAFEVLALADEVERLQERVAQARMVASRRVTDDSVALRLEAILDGQPDPRK